MSCNPLINNYGFDPETCQMLYGYQEINGKYYYFDPETGVAAKKKIVTIDDNKYYFGTKGARQTGLISYKGNKYYFDKQSGKMLTGWRKINRTVTMHTAFYNSTVSFCKILCSIHCKPAHYHLSGGATYYLNSKRRAVSGVTKISGKYYGFDPETCQMLYGYQEPFAFT